MSAKLHTQSSYQAAEATMLENICSRYDFMIETTRALADINSGSYNNEGIAKVNDHYVKLFGELGFSHETRELEAITQVEESGEISAHQPQAMQIFRLRPEAKLQILCTGHTDTVFPIDHAFQSTWIEGNKLRGPGTADMKGGLVVLLEALRAVEHSPFKEEVGFTVALSPDEEIGSPSSAKVLMELAQLHHFGMTYEPALADGTLAGARKGSGNFSVVAKGHSTHAGREFFAGKNALTAIAQLAIDLENLSNETSGITVNIGKISGGGPVNVVPDLGICRFNVRVQNPEQQKEIEDSIAALIEKNQELSGCELKLHGGFNRPPKIITPKQQQLFDLFKSCGAQLDIPIEFKATGGCCEGNNLAAAGLVNIDTLGVRGAFIHSDQEFACLDSFVERAQLSALLIAKLCQHHTNFNHN